jgi:hypothetical protein
VNGRHREVPESCAAPGPLQPRQNVACIGFLGRTRAQVGVRYRSSPNIGSIMIGVWWTPGFTSAQPSVVAEWRWDERSRRH